MDTVQLKAWDVPRTVCTAVYKEPISTQWIEEQDNIALFAHQVRQSSVKSSLQRDGIVLPRSSNTLAGTCEVVVDLQFSGTEETAIEIEFFAYK